MTFHGTLRNSLYVFERNEQEALLYQSLRFQAALPQGKALLAGNCRFLSRAGSIQPDDRLRLYALYGEVKGFQERAVFGFGRLFLHPGTPLGALDGLELRWQLHPQYRVRIYGGFQSPVDRRIGFESQNRRTLFGATLQGVYGRKAELQLFYLHRLGHKAALQRLIGLNTSYHPLSNVDLQAQTHFDLAQSRVHRLVFFARTQWSRRLQTSLEYREQQPQVYSDSYFTLFTPRPFQRWRAAASWEVLPEKFIELQAQHVRFETEEAEQLYLTFSGSYGEISAIYETGFAGDQIGFYANAFYDLTTRLTLSASVDLTRYRIEQIYEYDRQWSNALRLSYRFNRHLAVDLEGQWLNDRLRVYDMRLLNHITLIW